MAYEQLNLLINADNQLRRYYLYKGLDLRSYAEFNKDISSLQISIRGSDYKNETLSCKADDSFGIFVDKLLAENFIKSYDSIDKIGIKLKVPSSRFLKDLIIDDSIIADMEFAKSYSPTLVTAQLEEIYKVRQKFPSKMLAGLSDSAFNISKPAKAWNYGIDLYLADHLDIKRFGFFGLSSQFVVDILKSDLPDRLLICHISDTGIGLTAVKNGKCIDHTSGYAESDGPFSGQSSGSIAFNAIRRMKDHMNLNDYDMTIHLSEFSGLKGLSRSALSMQNITAQSKNSSAESKIAVDSFVYSLQKQIGSQVAALGGIDCLVFTGTIGASNAWLRHQIVKDLECFGLLIDKDKNIKNNNLEKVSEIHKRTRVNKILIIPSKEEILMAQILRSSKFN